MCNSVERDSLWASSTFHECVAFTIALEGPLWISNLLKEVTCLLTCVYNETATTQGMKNQLQKEGMPTVGEAYAPQDSA